MKDANVGLTIMNDNIHVKDSVFSNNEMGASVSGNGHSFSNCRFEANAKDGLKFDTHGTLSIEKCTFENNGGFGFVNCWAGLASFEACAFINNKGGGIGGRDWGAKVAARQCLFSKNKKYDVDHGDHSSPDEIWDFHQNYWGPSVTRLLQQRGDGANLSNIFDGRDLNNGAIVDVAEFLTEPPKDCGATVKF